MIQEGVIVKINESEDSFGGTMMLNGTSFHTTADIIDFSKKHKDTLFVLSSDNYTSGFGKYWVKNGKIARMETIGNPMYDFGNAKVSGLKIKSDNIVILRKFKGRF